MTMPQNRMATMPESDIDSAAAYAAYGAIITSAISMWLFLCSKVTCPSCAPCLLRTLKKSVALTANSTPTARDPTKMTRKNPADSISEMNVTPLLLKFTSVRYSTIATASFRTDSPNTSEYSSVLTPSSWNMASTVTGSVAEMRAPKTSAWSRGKL